MIAKNSVFYGEKCIDEILQRCGLYHQAFDFKIGLYNKNNELLDSHIEYDQNELIKVRLYPIFDEFPYCYSIACSSFYLPFHIRFRDKTIYLEIDSSNKL